ncbi:MAG: single-stranded DNA-binding protein [Gallionella sp.]|nr:single-stranded DNA-binding protein [Gallionella sp.]
MLKITAVGRLGQNAKHSTLQNGTDICSFSLACDVGFGDNKQTVWLDVAKFGKGADGLSKLLSKGDPVTVVGDLSTREHDGKTYLKCRADEVALQGGKREGNARPDDKDTWGHGEPAKQSYYDSEDDSGVPF